MKPFSALRSSSRPCGPVPGTAATSSLLPSCGQITADSVYCTVSELAAGLKKVGSVKEEKLLVVPIGMGCLDVAVAGIAYRKAFSLGLGESFSFDN